MYRVIRKIVICILSFLVFPKKGKILCSVDYYNINGKEIIRENDNVYLFSKLLKEKGEKIYYFQESRLKIRDIYNILTSEIIIHKTYPIREWFMNSKQKNIILGYFTPFKADRYLENMCLEKYGEDFFKKIESCNRKINRTKLRYITSSRYSSKVIASSNNISENYFIEIGMSRNQVVGISEKKFRDIFKIKDDKKINKIILYTPTFRDKYIYSRLSSIFDVSEQEDKNIFGYNNIEKEISKILLKNNIYIIIKLHKNYSYYQKKEEKILNNYIELPKNCFILTSEIEKEYNIGIYNLFDISDAMIADYSSISFDYLLKNKPIFYNIFDIEEYRKYRGFSYEPIEDLMAGEKIKSKDEFLDCLEKFGNNYKDIYQEKRKKVNLLVNGEEKLENINEKIYEFMKEFINER